MRTTRTSGKLFEGSGYSKASNKKKDVFLFEKNRTSKKKLLS